MSITTSGISLKIIQIAFSNNATKKKMFSMLIFLFVSKYLGVLFKYLHHISFQTWIRAKYSFTYRGLYIIYSVAITII